MPLTEITTDVWSALHLMSFPGGVRMPARMTVVRLPSSGVLLHSVVPIDDAMAAEIAAIGPVMQVVAPNLLHHLHIAPCLKRYPQAKLYAPEGLARKRPDLAVHAVLEDEAPPAWREVMDQIRIRGAPRLNEVVFCHRRSGTLIATDLVFNVQDPQGWATGMVLKIMGTYGKFAQSRLFQWRYAKDAEAVRASLAAILKWDFDRVLMAHGDPVEVHARDRLRAALLPRFAPPA